MKKPDSLITRWLNDPNPCGVIKKENNQQDIEISKQPIAINYIPEEEREEYFKKRFGC